MKIYRIDNDARSNASFSAFCRALNAPGESIFASLEECLQDPGTDVAIVVAHGAPFGDEISAYNLNPRPTIIRIGISVKAPRLRIAREFSSEQIADFEWPISAGAGLKDLGDFVSSKIPTAGYSNPAAILRAIVEYFDEKFLLDEPIAAYLLKTAGADSELEGFGLGRFKDKTAPELLALLADRVPRASH